jgi:hypothetical protein
MGCGCCQQISSRPGFEVGNSKLIYVVPEGGYEYFSAYLSYYRNIELRPCIRNNCRSGRGGVNKGSEGEYRSFSMALALWGDEQKVLERTAGFISIIRAASNTNIIIHQPKTSNHA